MVEPLRVIQWTTGNIGRRSLHAVLARPDYRLVGVYAHGAEKVGRDAAELCGWPEPTGVLATDDVDALLALRPDACCYNPLWSSTDDLVRLLETGINAVTTAGWITGRKMDPSERARVEDACRRGGATIYGSGAHPGLSNLVSLVLSGACEGWTPEQEGSMGIGKIYTALYGQRWEIESVFDELKTHQRGPHVILRSRTPQGVYQEAWGYLCVHYAIRALINKAADDDGLDPDRISFTNAIHATRRSVRARISRSITLARATQRAIAELLHTTLPPGGNEPTPASSGAR